MAKRKRKRQKKEKIELSASLYGIFLIIIAILGIGKLGPVGRLIASFSLFLSGSIYIVSLALLLIVGVYILIKGEKPEFISTKMLGFYLFMIGLLTFMHWDFVKLNDGNSSLIFKETIDQLVKGFNSLMASGSIEDIIGVGGGLIGGVFALLFSKLCSYLGMQIITITLIVVGLSLFTGFSIIEFTKERITVVAEKHKEGHKFLSIEKSLDKQPKRAPKFVCEKIMHKGVTCDGCGVYPIIGCRYKCAICPNFDYCENCEKKKWI